MEIDLLWFYVFIGLLVEFVMVSLAYNNKKAWQRIIKNQGKDGIASFMATLWVLWLPYVISIFIFEKLGGNGNDR